VHKDNLDEFKEMESLFRKIGVREWGIDVPCVSGRLEANREIMPPLEQAASLLKHAYGGSYHGGGEGYACGLHLATLTPEGDLLKCGFYPNEPLGTLREGLKKALERAKPIPLADIECGNCNYVSECAGGCRYRAPSPTAPDPVMCALYGIK
jgi:radical SAM protein with 4Fe4S-binding SPASM domain